MNCRKTGRQKANKNNNKVILNHFFEDFETNGTLINIIKYKDPKYAPYENIVNNLIKVILEKNNIIQINDQINKIVDIINIKSTL